MLTTLATLVAVSLTLQQGSGQGSGSGRGQGNSDTTVAVQQGARLDVNNFGGEIVVRTWNQSNVRVRASHSSRSRVEVSTSASTVMVRSEGRRGPPSIVDLEITVPTWMGMSLSGTYTDISVDGAGGAVTAESVQGDIEVTGGTGNINLKSVEGGVTLSKTKGRIEVNSVEGDITITDAVGDITVETVDGDIALIRVDAANTEVNTVDGDITYDGTIKAGGTYRFATHDGDLAIVIPPSACVSGSVSTFDGEIDPSFAVDTVRAGRHRITFAQGRCSNASRMELETFDGDIKLRRPGEVELEMPERDKHKWKSHDNDFDLDLDFDLNIDTRIVTRYATQYASEYASRYAPQYAAQYAAEYAPKYAREYAKQYAPKAARKAARAVRRQLPN
jgi:Putative adhesin